MNLFEFSYLPGQRSFERIPPSAITVSGQNLIFKLTNPLMPPLGLWVYSEDKSFMACVCYELPDLASPDQHLPSNRVTRVLDRTGIVSVQGVFPENRLIPVHAYLIPFRDLEIEDSPPDIAGAPNLAQFVSIVPVLCGANGGCVKPVRLNAEEAIAQMRSAFSVSVRRTRLVVGWLISPVLVLCFCLGVRRLMLLHRRFQPVLSKAHTSISFWRFLHVDLQAEARAAERLVASRQEEEAERSRLAEELRRLRQELHAYREQIQLTPDQAAHFETVTSSGSVEDLLALRETYQSMLDSKMRILEQQAQKERDREREIRRLEVEFEAINPDKRDKDARDAWALYLGATATEDSRTRLELLKEARKKLPKELRQERF